MYKLSVTALAALATTAAFAQLDYENLITHPGGGTGAIAGGDLSMLQTTPVAENIFGYGAQGGATNNIMADDFDAGAGFTVDKIQFFVYQTGATAPSITGASWAIGATASTALTAATPTVSWYNPNGVGIYRVTNGTTTDANRRIQLVEVDITDTLYTGVNWLSFNFTGTLASGPWAPPNPNTNTSFGKNAMQSIGGGAFNQVFVDAAGTTGADMPFILIGTPVPEPASMAVLGLGALALIRKRRSKKA